MKISFYTCVTLVCSFASSHGVCPFPPTGETLKNDCDFSSWLAWNCTCCGSDVSNYQLAVRQRGICCQNISNIVSKCLTLCGYSVTDDTEYGLCSSHCPGHVTLPTSCTYTTTTVSHLTTAAVAQTDTVPILLGSIGGCALLAGLLSCCIIFLLKEKKTRQSNQQKVQPQ